MARAARLIEVSKHIAIYYHFIRRKAERSEVVPQYVQSKKRVVDILTKRLAEPLHSYLESIMRTNLRIEDFVAEEKCLDVFSSSFQCD